MGRRLELDADGAPAPKGKRLTPVHVFKMNEAIGALVKGHHHVDVRLPKVLPRGARVWLREFNGGYTGHGYLAHVEGATAERTTLFLSWGWAKGKQDDDLSDLSLAILPPGPEGEPAMLTPEDFIA